GNPSTAAPAAFACPPGAARRAGIRGYGTGMEGVAAGPPAAGIQGFPVALTSFVGRAGVLREVGGLLAEYRLVTVTGPGGVGKTRLAGEIARQVADRFADGACLVELAPVPDPAQVPAGWGWPGGRTGRGCLPRWRRRWVCGRRREFQQRRL